MNNPKKTHLSHELMTQLYHMLGMAELIQYETDVATRRRYFAALMDAGDNLNDKLKILIESSEDFELEKFCDQMPNGAHSKP